MKFLRDVFIASLLFVPLQANHFDCPNACYRYYGDGSCNDCCGETCVAGDAYTQSTICNMRTGLLVGGPIVAGIIALLIWTSHSHAHVNDGIP